MKRLLNLPCQSLVAATFLLSATAARADLSPLSADEMGAVSGQEGVSFEWDLRINADATGAPLAICTGADRTACRIALEYENRSGEWVVFKGFSGRFYWSRFNLDAFTAPASGTGVGDMSRFSVQPYSKPHLSITFPEPLEIYNFQMAKVAIEYGATGYAEDPGDTRTFMGLAIGNSVAGQPGTMTFEGQMTVWGF